MKLTAAERNAALILEHQAQYGLWCQPLVCEATAISKGATYRAALNVVQANYDVQGESIGLKKSGGGVRLYWIKQPSDAQKAKYIEMVHKHFDQQRDVTKKSAAAIFLSLPVVR